MKARSVLVIVGAALAAGISLWAHYTPDAGRTGDRPPAVQQQQRQPSVEQSAPTPKASEPQPGVPGAGRQLPFTDPDVVREVNRTLDLISRGGPFPHRQDGVVFQNREGRLPKGEYHEYTVETPGSRDRGARRIVVDRRTGRKYYSGDHYRSFTLIDPVGAEDRGGGGRP